nr:hypothetical protein [Propionicimonas sp.]
MKIVLSRKGFDSQYGRIPSPILPDGTLLSLPIPTSESGRRFTDLMRGDRSYADLIVDLGGNAAMAQGCCHLDPDLRPGTASGWVPAFGQTGAAQTHLANQGVGVGDLFLFFGRFRQTELGPDGRLRYVRHAPDQHTIFGYLQVGAVEQGERVRDYWWHPHAENPDPLPNNTLYLGADRLMATDLPGAGVLDYREDRVLTAPGQSLSRWRILDWMTQGKMSYHSALSIKDGYFQSAAKGQEFVVEATADALEWAQAVIRPMSS